MATLAERLLIGLTELGVDTVFGIPGVHTVELYRALANSPIRHVTPRHEQGAGFMADGYYRATGRVAAAFVITGPGLTNILTPMAQAYADSIPMIVVSSVGRSDRQGQGGDLHEIRNQSLIAAQAAAFSVTVTGPEELSDALTRARFVIESARPRPIHIQIPLNHFPLEVPAPVASGAPDTIAEASTAEIESAAGLLRGARRPVLIAGGGARRGTAPEAVRALAERLGAPLVMTTNGRGVLPDGHPLSVPTSPSLGAVRGLVGGADVVIAIGTEFGRTDYDVYDEGAFWLPGTLIHVDLEPAPAGPEPDLMLIGDAGLSIRALTTALGDGSPVDGGTSRAEEARAQAWQEIGGKYRRIVGMLDVIRDTLPAAPIVCDSTQAAYAGNLCYAADAPRRWFNAATGYGALGYGLPAAIGAAVGTASPVVCIAGDGGLQFSLTDLGCAVEEELPLILLVWNNRGYGEIKDYMLARQITPVGVDLVTPDFVAIARAYGAEALQLEQSDDFPVQLRAAASRKGPTVIEIDEALILGS